MTVRAVIIGLLLGLALAAGGYFNDWVMKQAYVASDLVPVSVYGLLLVGLLGLNPLLGALRLRPLGAGEWCVIVSLMLVACVIPGPGLMWNFSNTLVMPHDARAIMPGWKKDRLLDYVPDVMLADPGQPGTQRFDRVVGGFKTGLNPGKTLDPLDVPWEGWTRTLSFWMPVVGLSFVAGVCLVLMVHRQWAHRERLRYPVADFATELIRGAGSSRWPAIFHNHRFWIGCLVAGGILMVNGYQKWNEGFIQIPMSLDMTGLATAWPVLSTVPSINGLIRPGFYFAAIGFAYFVSSEVSFSLGISHLVHAVLFIALARTGIDLSSNYIAGGIPTHALFGAYLGTAVIIAYVGRRYYLHVLGGAFGMSTGAEVDRAGIWGCRIALLAAGAMVVVLTTVTGLHWALAVAFVALTGMLFLVLTRVSVETGLFFIQPTWHAVSALLGLFGIVALGPNMMVVLGVLSTVVTIDPRVALMPMAANAMHFSESAGVRRSRLAAWMIVAVLLALVVGVGATLYVQYAHGGASLYNWPNSAAKFPFEALQRELRGLGADPDTWQAFRPSAIHFDPNFVYPVLTGLGLVLVCSWLRLRYNWWPIHPVLFLVWGTFPMTMMAASFLVGWAIKSGITRFGGSRAYKDFKPFFVGLVAGEFMAGIFWSIVGITYYLITGVPGPMFRVHP